MSLLEDIFLEDEAGEAQELERVIEGDEYDERPQSRSDSDENSEKEDEAVEEKQRVDPTKAKQKRIVKNPRFVLNPARLTGPRGIQVIPEHFKDFKFKGKGHEKEDLDLILKKLEHWAYRLYPKFKFEDCLKKIETLGKKRPVMVHLHKIRFDQLLSEETVVQKDSSDEEAPVQEEDEFDKLLQQQIELARATPAPGTVKKGFITPGVDKRSPLSNSKPKATSSPSISDEQRERIMQNRRLAEERRFSRLKNNTFNSSANSNTETSNAEVSVTSVDLTSDNKNVDNQNDAENDEEIRVKKTNKSFVIDSDEDEVSNNKQTDMEVDLTQDQDNCNVNKIRKVGNNTNNMSLNGQNNIINQNEPAESIDITEGYEFRNRKLNNDETNNINEVIDLVNAEVQNTNNNKIRSNISNNSDDECELNSVNVSVTVDVHKSSSQNIEIVREGNAKEIENSNAVASDAIELLENENHVVAFHNEAEISKEMETNEENKNSHKENLSDLNENSKEFGEIDKENIDGNLAQSVGLNDVMDVDFSDDF